jgi:hypothetical protein
MRIEAGMLVALTLSACGIAALDDDKMNHREMDDTGGEAGESDDGLGMSDANLEACVRAQLNIDEDELTPETVADLEHLDCPTAGISSIAGLQHFTGLQSISLWENSIEDISYLAGLDQLEWLELGANDISDVSALAGLTGLTRLGLSSNDIEDINALEGLTQLQWLHLDGNRITDVGALSDMDAITWLTIEHNDIDDDSVLDSIEDGGADVYGQNQGSFGPEGPPAPEVSTSVAPRASIEDGVFISRMTEDGGLQLDFMTLGGIHPVMLEVPGHLSADGDRIVLERGALTIAVGQLDGDMVTLCEGAYATDCHIALGAKTAPAAAYGGIGEAPVVYTLAMGIAARPEADEAAYGEIDDGLVQYALASPNQFDAGSCLFMSNTGAMELLIRQQENQTEQDYEGDSDLSERFLMAAYQDMPGSWLPYWLTDTVYAYNYHGGSMLNRDYPFTAGYVRETSSGLQPCSSSDSGAYYSCSYNWFDYRPTGWEEMMVDTPEIHRTVMYTDPARNSNSQWNVGLMDDEDVEKIKYLLRTRQAPVIVVYNHYLYWHADIIVGYDDTVSTGGCPMVESSMNYFDEQGAGSYSTKIEGHMADIGDCTDKGIFYVRDSIYEGTSDEPVYNYSSGFSERYSRRVIERSYNWVKFLGNHAYGIHRR